MGLISCFPRNRQPWVVLDGKPSQEYPVNVGVLQGIIVVPALFIISINDLPVDVICDIAIYADDTTLYSKCDQGSDLWFQPELASELESDLEDTVGWSRKWLENFNAGKTQLVLFDQSNNFGAIDLKMDGSVLEEISSFKMKYFLIGMALVDVHLNWLNWLHFPILKGGLLIILIDSMVFLSPSVDVTKMSMSTVSFLTQLDSGILCL